MYRPLVHQRPIQYKAGHILMEAKGGGNPNHDDHGRFSDSSTAYHHVIARANHQAMKDLGHTVSPIKQHENGDVSFTHQKIGGAKQERRFSSSGSMTVTKQ